MFIITLFTITKNKKKKKKMFLKKKLFTLRLKKKRYKLKERVGSSLLKGDFYINVNKEIYFNIRNISKIKKYHKVMFNLRKKKKAKKFFISNKTIWIFLKKNTIITKKPKNSRMGNGKGNNLKLICLLKKNLKFLEYIGYNKYLISKIFLQIKKKIKIDLSIVNCNCKKTHKLKSSYFLKTNESSFNSSYFLYYKFKKLW